MSDKAFFDTNVILYLISNDEMRVQKTESLLLQGGVVSVQNLNECANISLRKLGRSWMEIQDLLFFVRTVCTVVPVTTETHERGLLLAERYRLSVYDGMIWAAAILSNCTVLYSEDMQHGLKIGNTLLHNPFLEEF